MSLTLKPKLVTKRLLLALPDRARDVIVRRYGLGDDSHRMTLESIGEIYSITRERVRQIENYALATIRKSDAYKKEAAALDELEQAINKLGGIIPESGFLSLAAGDKSTQNHIHFLLVVGNQFMYEKEDEHFTHRWHVDEPLARKVEDALKNLYEHLEDDELVQEHELIQAFLDHLKDIADHYHDEEILKRWLSLSKRIGKNPLGHWGRAESANVHPRGIRDYAYLVISQHGSPLHFSEVAKKISNVFEKRAHIATTHNELIKDGRFVLVGRGLYALKEWGYMRGVVKDVIKAVLEKHGPLSRDEIIDKVLKERYVKENTILVNLQDTNFFKKTKEGKYSLV